MVFWRPSTPVGELLATAVGDIAATFADADIVWLDDRLAALEPEPPGLAQARLACRTRSLEAGPGRRELRLACDASSTQPRAVLEGHVILADDVPNAGMIGRLALDGHAPLSRLVVAGGSYRREANTETLQLRLRESGLGLRARLAGGERLAPLQLRIGPDGEAAIELRGSTISRRCAPLWPAWSRLPSPTRTPPWAPALCAGAPCSMSWRPRSSRDDGP